MAQGHAMPEGIKRIGKGVYRTLDEKVEIRQTDKGWIIEPTDGSVKFQGEPFRTRGEAVEHLRAHPLPQAEPKPAEEMTGKELTEVKPELHPGDAPEPESAIDLAAKVKEPAKRRLTARKPRSKAAAKV